MTDTTTEQPTYFHGGAPGLRPNQYILPPDVTGARSTSDMHDAPRADAALFCPLIDPELAILRLISRGVTDMKIGKATSHSERTISSMVGRMMKRTETVTRTHLIATALRNGWIR